MPDKEPILIVTSYLPDSSDRFRTVFRPKKKIETHMRSISQAIKKLPANAEAVDKSIGKKAVESNENKGKTQRAINVNSGENNRTGSVLRPTNNTGRRILPGNVRQHQNNDRSTDKVSATPPSVALSKFSGIRIISIATGNHVHGVTGNRRIIVWLPQYRNKAPDTKYSALAIPTQPAATSNSKAAAVSAKTPVSPAIRRPSTTPV